MSPVKCKAKDPKTCPYHGAEIKMNEAIAAQDFDKYYEARAALEALTNGKTWDENILEVAEPLTPEELENFRKEILVPFGGDVSNLYRKVNEFTNRGKTVDIRGFDEPFGIEKVQFGAPDDGSGWAETYFILSHKGRMFKFVGTYSSWDGNEWNDNYIEEVEKKVNIITQVLKDFQTRNNNNHTRGR